MIKKYSLVFILSSLSCLILNLYPLHTKAFTKFADLLFDGDSVTPGTLEDTLETIKKNKESNKKIKGARNKLPTKISLIEARQTDPKNIKFEINTSELLVKSERDIQVPISNLGFLNAIQEALTIFENVEIADIMFAPLKFTSAEPDTNDGINTITFRNFERAEEGAPAQIGGGILTIVNFAKTEKIRFMNETIKVKPGTILDTDIIYDPANDPCLAYFLTQGPLKRGGDDSALIVEGGVDLNEIENCDNKVSTADIVDFAIRGISRALGLESSAIASAATARVPENMIRYALTNDDEIGLANLYPKNSTAITRGLLTGKLILNKTPVFGAHIVLEDTNTGEPIAGTFTDFDGNFEIRFLPPGLYSAYAEPLDGRTRPTDFVFNTFASNGKLNFTTAILKDPITIEAGMTTNIQITFNNHPGAAFNINTQVISSILTEAEAISGGLGATPLPIKIMPGETLMNVLFWGDNISTDFGTLSVSGPGIIISNLSNTDIAISPHIECQDCEDTAETMCRRSPLCPASQELIKQADRIPGIKADITCSADIQPGPRTIIFTGDKLEHTHPSFNLRDQLTGALFVTE